MNNILLIEDNEQLQKYITDYLYAYGYIVHTLDDYDSVLETISVISPTLILLDINLPKYDGFYYLKLIRKYHNTPIVILSARSEDSEQIRGIDGGANDYITKPFSIGVLVAKINAMIRKLNIKEENLSIAGLKLCTDTMELIYNNSSTSLTKNEYRILRLLINNVGQIVTREQILEELWDDVAFIDDNTLTVNITRVRKKLSGFGIADAISTKRGYGYVFDSNFSKNIKQ